MRTHVGFDHIPIKLSTFSMHAALKLSILWSIGIFLKKFGLYYYWPLPLLLNPYRTKESWISKINSIDHIEKNDIYIDEIDQEHCM